MSTEKIRQSEEQLSSGKSRATIANAGKVDGESSKSIDTSLNPSRGLDGQPSISRGSLGNTSNPSREGVSKINSSSSFNQKSKDGETIVAGFHNYGISSSNLQAQLDADVAQDIAWVSTGVILGNSNKQYKSRENSGENLNNTIQNVNDRMFGANFTLEVKDIPGAPNHAYKGVPPVPMGRNASMPNIVYTGNVAGGTWTAMAKIVNGSSSRNASYRLHQGNSVLPYLTQAPYAGSGIFNLGKTFGMNPHSSLSGVIPNNAGLGGSGIKRSYEIKCPENSSIRIDAISEGFSYTPKIHGELAKIVIDETSWIELSSPSGAQNKLATAGSGTKVIGMPILQQDQKIFRGSGMYHDNSFAHWYPSGVLKEYEQKDFVDKDGNNPDFSDSGNQIKIGYSRSLSQGAGSQYFTNINAISDFNGLLIPSGLPVIHPMRRYVNVKTALPHSSSGVKQRSFDIRVNHFCDGYDKVLSNLLKFAGE